MRISEHIAIIKIVFVRIRDKDHENSSFGLNICNEFEFLGNFDRINRAFAWFLAGYGL